MPSQLESRIGALRGRVRRLLALHGAGRVVVATTLAILAAVTLDWLIHLVPEVRVALLGLLGLLAGWVGWRHLLAPLVVRFRDLDIALKIERRWPGLNDRLSSTVEFLRAGDSDPQGSLGSPALRDATVARTLKELDGIDFRAVVDPRPARRWALGALGVLGLAVVTFAVAPAAGRIALTRLFRPYSGLEWPKQTELEPPQFARKVARGEPFELAVAVRQGKTVPASAKVTYTFADGQKSTESLRPDDRGVFHGRIDAVERPFTFSVVAGDDRTGRHEVLVVPPPALKSLTVALIPPAYTGQGRTELAPGHTQVRAVEGTAVEIAAQSTKPLASALLRRGPGSPVAATLGARGMSLSNRFIVADSSPFWFDLKDTEGFAGRDPTRFDLRALKDEAPRVVFEEPPGDREITPDGVLPLRITTEDDFGLQAVRLLYKVGTASSEPTREGIVPLWEPSAAGPAPVLRQVVTHEWKMADLRASLGVAELAPGTLITFHADARDFLPAPKGPNLGKSRELRLKIVSRDEAANRLEEQRRAIREEAERALAMQKSARLPVQDALRTLDRTPELDQAARDALRNAESIQRQVTGRVAGVNEGLDRKINQFLEDLKNLKLDNPDARAQMEALKAGVDRLKAAHLDQAEQSLARGSKALSGQPPEPGAQPDAPKAGVEAGAPEPKGPPSGAAKPGSKPDAAPPGGAPKPGPKPDAGAPPGGAKPDAADGAKPDTQANATDGGKPEAGSKPDGGKPEAAKAAGAAKPGEPKPTTPGGETKPTSPPGETKPTGGGGETKPTGPGGQTKPTGTPGETKPTGAGGETKPTPPAGEALARADTHQKGIADELQKMVDDLKEFDTYRGVVKEAENLLKQQEEALKQSAEAAARPNLAGKPAEGLTPQQKSELDNLAARQSDIGKGLQSLEGKMDDLAGRTDPSDPLAAGTLKDAAANSRKQGTAAKMGDASQGLAKNQMGAARADQEKARQDLKNLVDAIKDRRASELARLVKELKGAAAELDKLKGQQAANLAKTKEAGAIPDAQKRKDELQKLAKPQAEIKEQLEKQLKRLKKLKADAAARAGAKASGKMGKSQEDLDDGDDDGDDAAKEQEEALKDLEEANEEIADQLKEAEEQLAMEQLSKMADALKALKAREDKMIAETETYEKARAGREDKLTPGQRASVRGLAREQGNLKTETDALAETLEGAPVFALTLRRAAESMDVAAKRLGTLKTDDDTRRAQRSAARRYEQLLETLKVDKKDGQGGGGAGGGGGGGGKAPKPGDGIPDVAQVKMLKMLQEELNTRTEELDEIKERHKTLTDQQDAELSRLQEEQGTIADLARDLTRPKRADGEE